MISGVKLLNYSLSPESLCLQLHPHHKVRSNKSCYTLASVYNVPHITAQLFRQDKSKAPTQAAGELVHAVVFTGCWDWVQPVVHAVEPSPLLPPWVLWVQLEEVITPYQSDAFVEPTEVHLGFMLFHISVDKNIARRLLLKPKRSNLNRNLGPEPQTEDPLNCQLRQELLYGSLQLPSQLHMLIDAD